MTPAEQAFERLLRLYTHEQQDRIRQAMAVLDVDHDDKVWLSVVVALDLLDSMRTESAKIQSNTSERVVSVLRESSGVAERTTRNVEDLKQEVSATQTLVNNLSAQTASLSRTLPLSVAEAAKLAAVAAQNAIVEDSLAKLNNMANLVNREKMLRNVFACIALPLLGFIVGFVLTHMHVFGLR